MAFNLIKHATRLGFLRSIRTAPRLRAKFKDGGEQSTFNDMPIPEGCWKEFNAKRQSRQTTMLLSGLAAFVASIVYFLFKGDPNGIAIFQLYRTRLSI
ncbi:gomdanji isoform X2 [Musca autumnalis]|uniref:gomdanji isoform X2 n=1 Tax=Musca autumnalis TaxID=221902 RepID=UPI003CFA30C2